MVPCTRRLRPPVGSHQKATRQPRKQQEETAKIDFMSLPIEIRLLIWEATWPEPRVIGHCMTQTGNGAERRAIHYLRAVGSLEAYSHLDYYNILNHAVIEPCPDPIALQICRESREHTLRTYTPMIHNTFGFGSFYFDPKRDTLLLCWDFDQCKPSLIFYYGAQMLRFEKILVDGHFWAKDFSSHYEDVLRAFKPVNPQPQWLFGALYEAWGVNLDPCGVRAAVKFVSTILNRVDVFQQQQGRPVLQENTEEMVVAEDFGKIVVDGSEDGGEEGCLGVTGYEDDYARDVYTTFREFKDINYVFTNPIQCRAAQYIIVHPRFVQDNRPWTTASA
ncbi:hypothetical protein BO78DRAFT_390906 [Aspergillus sclerotiicarbonarius CBS 121057]|uniref:2EXR domain-containing protein n=1 Tax=Aspergillus sclerotiicarbonarius (strain CBS 121057 / IBT 28362) TaxID=1448318 RepID=A0A319E5C8_ASPSB|nr:hypothetical protein BO78DRAFT_390906 [Aspergillus sclerotiicarbonarius CBS 121057]